MAETAFCSMMEKRRHAKGFPIIACTDYLEAQLRNP